MACVNYIPARGNGKSLLTFVDIIDELGIRDDIIKIKERCDPFLQELGVLDDLPEYKKLMIYLYIYNPEIFPTRTKDLKR